MIRFPVISGQVLGVTVYRGYAPLQQLSRVSRADVYDAESNPTGTQRDLSPKHAREAYEYIRNNEFGYWPEVFLSARDPSVVQFEPSQTDADVGYLIIDDEKIRRSSVISISRVDGNHRLH
jgi:hypothetical protein